MVGTGEPSKTRLKSIIFPQRYNYTTLGTLVILSAV